MKRCFYYVFILLLAGGALSSCLDNEEPKGREELRGAMSELYKAYAQVQLSEVELNKAEAALKMALVEQQNLKNKQIEVETEKLQILNEREKILNDREKLENEKRAVDVELKQLELVKEQAGLDHQQALRELELKGKQAELDTYMKRLAVEMKGYENRIQELDRELELAVENHKVLLLKAQEDLARAEKAYEDALKEIEAQKVLLTAEQQQMLNPVLEQLKEVRGKIKGKQAEIVQAERDLIDLMVNFDPESYGKKLALKVTEKELLLAEAQKMKDRVAIFNTKPFSEWEKQLTEMEDTLAKVKVEQDLITKKIAETELGKQPFENKIDELNATISKKNIEKNKLNDQLNELNNKYYEVQDVAISVPVPALEDLSYVSLYRNPYWTYINTANVDRDPVTSKVSLTDHLLHFDVGLRDMNLLLLGGTANGQPFGGIIAVFKNLMISAEDKAQAQLQLNDYNKDKALFAATYAAAKTAWEKTVTNYKEAEVAYGFGEIKDQQVLAREAWEKYGNTDPSKRVKKDTTDMLAAIKGYVDKRTVLDGDPGYTVWDPVAGENKPLSEVLTYDFYKAYSVNSGMDNVIGNVVYMPRVGDNGPQGGAYLAWWNASSELYGTSRLTELALSEFDGKLVLDESGNIMSVPGLNEVLNKLNLRTYSLQNSLWFKKYKAEYLYDNLNLRLSLEADLQKLYENAVAKQAEVEAAIKAVDAEIQAVEDQIQAIDEEITALNEQIDAQRDEIAKIDIDQIDPLKMMYDATYNSGILARRYADLDNIRTSILTIMGENGTGDLWYQDAKAEEIKADIERLMNRYEQNIADAEAALAQAKKALERFNQGGDQRQTEIADQEQKIKDLTAELEELQKEFTELTAKKDALMEIFVGSEK